MLWHLPEVDEVIGARSDTAELVCHECVGDPFLKAEIKANGRAGLCSRCARRRRAISVDDLKWRIDEVFKSNFQPGLGRDAARIFADIAGIGEAFAGELVDDLSSSYGYLAGRGRCDDPYDFEGFEECGPDHEAADDRWHAFQKTVRQEARFFNRAAENWLDDIFTGLDAQRTWGNEGVICRIGVDDENSGFYRARVASSEAELGRILSSPMAELGPPPNGNASAGRMNAAGVSVFYGAVDVETCISEIRPPVGASVVVGRFHLLRPVRLLDFDLLAQIEAHGSHFDPHYIRKRDGVHFLRAFGRQIARPILPGDEAFGYLPTQVVADYLAQRLAPAIDGMFYRSTQTGSKGRNVVLFNRAARVQPLDTSIEIDLEREWRPYEGHDDGVTIVLKKRAEPGPLHLWQEHFDDRPKTLRLDLEALQVMRMQATRYDVEQRPTHILPVRQPAGDIEL